VDKAVQATFLVQHTSGVAVAVVHVSQPLTLVTVVLVAAVAVTHGLHPQVLAELAV
jgi:hypothetical protein